MASTTRRRLTRSTHSAGNGRGVAVIDPGNTPDAALADMHRRGVRGLRINLYSPLGAGQAHGRQLRRDRGHRAADELAHPGDRAAAACC